MVVALCIITTTTIKDITDVVTDLVFAYITEQLVLKLCQSLHQVYN